ncbi:hypothetical protein ACJQWK_08224 [Exserohilum turcicum]|uniref:F-box domain-containing protein n=1 Tax=Exserohilum turcicum (strain 28A) TaxID=671987 RepID=R0K1J6_EXST2|nr:uncharacterized protein SETTUDRAFT_163093 [Exserohilum turcica Et28A]EOA87018.1 hypothetical protein SETTUDRAFT_163093 [Exserohilum turcica Et28A]
MGFFRRSLSFSSSRSSRQETDDSSASDTASSRTSIDSAFQHEVSESLATITKAPPPSLQKAPILTLPLELIQQVNTHLDTASAAAFCLSSRFIYYALGTNMLSGYFEASKNRFEKRRSIEAVVERAFPGHWFCGWCDRFHAWSADDGPTAPLSARGKQRECADFNSYLHAGSDYALRYHHIRLAINRSQLGPEHGIPLSAFSHEHKAMAKLFKTPVPTKLQISAKIAKGRFLLHTSYAIILPAFATRNRNLLSALWPLFPHILVGHRASENGHTGLMAAVDNVVRRGWKYQFTQNCAMCATDWAVSAQQFSHATGSQMRLVVQTWRDVGSARTPFETAWRAHGVCVSEIAGKSSSSSSASTSTCLLQMAGLQPGSIRRTFDSAVAPANDLLHDSPQPRTRSTSKPRIYRSFMRRGTHQPDSYDHDEDHDDDHVIAVRRSRARPSYARTKEENDEAARIFDDEMRDAARNVAERTARMEVLRLQRGGRRWLFY